MAKLGPTAASSLAVALLLLFVVGPAALVLLLRRRLRRASARREEVRRLALLAAAESERALREADREYAARLAAPVTCVPYPEPEPAPGFGDQYGVPTAQAPVLVDSYVGPTVQVPADATAARAVAAKGVCAVCSRPTTRRCKECKAVKYCSFECQRAHWKQGHKDECHPPSIRDKSDSALKAADMKNGKIDVEQVARTCESASVRPESSEPNHLAQNFDMNGRSKDLPPEDASVIVDAPEGSLANKVLMSSINAQIVENTSETSTSTVRNGEIDLAKPMGTIYRTKNLDKLASLSRAEAAEGKQTVPFSKISDPSVDNRSSEKAVKHQDHSIGDGISYIDANEKPMENHTPQASRAVEGAKSSRIRVPSHVISSFEGRTQLEHMENADIDSSILDGHFGASKKAENASRVRSSEGASTIANGPVTSLKRIVKQYTTPKVVRQYPSDLMTFPYELFVKLYTFDKVDLHPFGLVNLGNSCYANAVLQCLTFTRPLTAYLLEGLHSKKCSNKGWCFMCKFETLVREGKRGKSSLRPTEILSHLHDIGSSFDLGKQEDAHEFLRYAIDTMQSVCMKEAGQNGTGQLAEETTLVQLTFGGCLRSKIRCTKCQSSSEHCERILDLTVAIDGDISSLEEALSRFTSTEVLDGENKYQCSRCKSYEKARKQLKILEAPNVLTIALKRYQSGKFGKINKAIKFPETLNLARYMSGTDDKAPVYRLYAVVVHHDIQNATFSGHYVCYVKDTEGKWYKINDSEVKPVSLEKVLSKSAYMLLYARCSPRAPSAARRAMSYYDPARLGSKRIRSKTADDTGSGNMRPRDLSVGAQGVHLNREHIQFETFVDGPYSPSDSPSPSDSSFFSNSDTGSYSTLSTDSTESTRNSTSTEEQDHIFGHDLFLRHWDQMCDDVMESAWSSRCSVGSKPGSSGREAD